VGNFLDGIIGYVSPERQLRREGARKALATYGGGGESGYDGAGMTRLDTTWGSSQQAASMLAPVSWQLTQMRDRARNLDRNNALANGMMTRITESVIGDGLSPIAETADPIWNSKAESLLNDWSDSADITGLSWAEHQQLMFRSLQRDGDCGAILTDDGRLQGIEGDLIGCFEKQDALTIDGISVNENLRPITYWIKDVDTLGSYKARPVDAQDFIFLANRNRLRQLRGEPLFAQSFQLFDQVDRYITAVVTAAEVAACFSIAVIKDSPTDATQHLDAITNRAGKKQRALNVEPGGISYLRPGESISTINPSQPSQNFSESLKTLLRLLGQPAGLPLELVLIDFETGSYSASRAALMTAYQSFNNKRKKFADKYLSRVYRWKISQFVKLGLLEARDDAWNHRWVGAPYPYLDPLKEAMAIQARVDVGVTTLAQEIAAVGGDVRVWAQKRAEELSLMRGNRIPVYHAATSMPLDGPTPTTATANTPNDDDEDEPTNSNRGKK
jgi:lambda family phage portal protein